MRPLAALAFALAACSSPTSATTSTASSSSAGSSTGRARGTTSSASSSSTSGGRALTSSGTSTGAASTSGAGTSSSGSSGTTGASASGSSGAGTSGGFQGTDEVAGSTYGMPFTADSLQNWTVGGEYSNNRVSYRFRAPHSGALDHLVVFFIFNVSHSGYALGSGGTVQLTLYPDDGSAQHLPDTSASPLGQFSTTFALDGGYVPGGGSDDAVSFQTFQFASSPPSLTAGALYHLIFANLDPTPQKNYVSVDGLVWFGEQAPARGRASITDWGVLIDSGSGFQEWSLGEGNLNTPVLSVAYADGTSFGCGYMEVWPANNGIQAHAVDGSGNGVRERFTPERGLTLSDVSLRVSVVTPGALVATLEQDQGATVEGRPLQQGSTSVSADGYATVTFPQPQAVTAATEYDIAFTGADGGAFTSFCLRDGSADGFDPGSVFSDGFAQYTTGSGWDYWYGWSASDDPSYVDGDLQFYFHTL